MGSASFPSPTTTTNTETLMSLTQNSDGSFTFTPSSKKVGLEDIPLGGCLPLDLTGDGSSTGLMGGLEFSTGGVLSLGIYAGLHKFLILEPARKAGLCDRSYQFKMVKEAAWENTQEKAIYVIAIGLLAACFPGLGGLLAVSGLIGSSFIFWRLGQAFFASLDAEQIAELKKAADQAGMSVPGLDDAAAATSGGDADSEPLPQFS